MKYNTNSILRGSLRRNIGSYSQRYKSKNKSIPITELCRVIDTTIRATSSTTRTHLSSELQRLWTFAEQINKNVRDSEKIDSYRLYKMVDTLECSLGIVIKVDEESKNELFINYEYKEPDKLRYYLKNKYGNTEDRRKRARIQYKTSMKRLHTEKMKLKRTLRKQREAIKNNKKILKRHKNSLYKNKYIRRLHKEERKYIDELLYEMDKAQPILT